MYALKPVSVLDQDIQLPKCMYNLKPVSIADNMPESKNNTVKSEVDLLEERQSTILKKLDELKQTLMAMRGDLKLCAKPPQPNQQQQQKSGANAIDKKVSLKPIDVSKLAEVVINVHPKNVPFSILALKNLWKNRLNLHAEVFTHSSVKEEDFSNIAKDFAQKIATPTDQSNLPTLKVTIIFKDVETTQMISSPLYIPLFGEVNIIRFLNRVGPNEFWYEEDNHVANQHDIILDICYQLSKQHSTADRQKYIQILSKLLGKNKFFNGLTELSISDVAVSSTFKKASNLKELPANLSSWLQKISTIAGY